MAPMQQAVDYDVARTRNTTTSIGQERLLRDDLVEAVQDALRSQRACASDCFRRNALVPRTIGSHMSVPGEDAPPMGRH